MLHIRCGHDLLPALAEAPGKTLFWPDAPCQGPLPAGLAEEDWLALRARFLSSRYGTTFTATLAALGEAVAALDAALAEDEVVIWSETDFYDQAVLVQILAWYAGRGGKLPRLSLVTLDVAAGTVTADQVRAVLPRRQPVTAEALKLARRVWAGLCAPQPAPLLAVLADGTAVLPFLEASLRRHLAELPAVNSGLSLTEELLLAAAAAQPGAGWPALFARYQAAEARPWLGDTMARAVLNDLVQAREPALSKDLVPTEFGRALLEGQADWVRVNGLDRWVGGIRLGGRRTPWRRGPGAGRGVLQF